FAGPLFPNSFARPELLPVVPDLPGMRMQVLHTSDAADAFRRAVHSSVHGAFNLAAEPTVDAAALAEMFGARRMALPSGPVRAALALGWALRAVPASPELFDAALRMPIMDTTRAYTELSWSPRYSAQDTLREFLTGLRRGAGIATAALAADRPAEQR